MPPKLCQICKNKKAHIKRPKTAQQICLDCFYEQFETEVHLTIQQNRLFSRGEKVAIAASGGKDSTVLAHVMTTLNERYDYGLDLYLLSIDEGIKGYRDDSLKTVESNSRTYQLPLTILSYHDLYGYSMDDIVKEIGLKNNCTYCGVFRRQALDRGAWKLGIRHIVTGHNADDLAETVLMNILRGDIARLQRCTSITSGPVDVAEESVNDLTAIKRSKPFKFAYEKEIVMYSYFKKLEYFSTECIYSPNAYRGNARTFLKDLEQIRPTTILDIIHSGEALSLTLSHQQQNQDQNRQNIPNQPRLNVKQQKTCTRCGYISSNDICKACMLLQGLDRSKPAKEMKIDGKMHNMKLDTNRVSARAIDRNW